LFYRRDTTVLQPERESIIVDSLKVFERIFHTTKRENVDQILNPSHNASGVTLLISKKIRMVISMDRYMAELLRFIIS